MPDCEPPPFEYDSLMIDMSQRIRDLRDSLGLSQKHFAAEAGVTQATVSKWEAGTQVPKGPALINLARMAGTDVFTFSEEARETAAYVRKKTYSIPVRGVLEKGVFKNELGWPESENYTVTVPFPSDMRLVEGYAVEIKGDFLDSIYPDGSIVIFNNIENVSDVVSGDVLYIMTKYKDGRTEHAAWLLRINGNTTLLTSASQNVDIYERRFWARGREDDATVEERVAMGVAITSIRFDRVRIPRGFKAFVGE